MSHFLLDTHSLIWFFKGDAQLSRKARTIIDDEENIKFISIVSAWEMTIKQSKGREFLDLGTTVDNFVEQKLIYQDFQLLPVELSHLKVLSVLPVFQKHKEPFDRLLIAQAMSENLSLISCDSKFKDYPIDRIW
ncbi:MAG: type II toxin-antitoxin system VapC family toxin [Pseudanabaena sp. M110S1SP2A07QC]|nr:type II toxin-antitoxin system VapC family toxin [Pseudanabaena sp. M110S1SP2A07QC]